MFPLEVIHGDRRTNRRYRLETSLRFSYEHRGITHFYSGLTQDLSRGGIRFLADCRPPDGASVEVRIPWPILLQNVCPLELLIWGTIARTDESGTVVKIRCYEFRTCGERSFEQASARAESCNIVG